MPILHPAAQKLLPRYRVGQALSGRLPRRFFMTDQDIVPDWRAVLAHLPKKSGVILRDYHHPKRSQLAHDMADACRAYNHVLLIGADIGLAQKLSLGLHMPEALAPRLIWRMAQYRKGTRARGAPARPLHATLPVRSMPPITMAAHSFRAVRLAAQLGVDGVFLAPIFTTPSHPKAAPLGVIRLAQLCQYAQFCGNLPIFALGGMDEAGWRRIRSCGAYGYAGIRGIVPPNSKKR